MYLHFKAMIKAGIKKISGNRDRDRELKPQWTRQGPGSILMERYHYIDEGTQDKDGFYDYYYEYDVYYFKDGDLSLIARCYADEPDEANFMGIEFDGYDRALEPDDRTLPLVCAALTQLKSDGKTKFFTFAGTGYEPIFGRADEDIRNEGLTSRCERIEVIALSPQCPLSCPGDPLGGE